MSVLNNLKLTWQLINEITDVKIVNKENIKTIIKNDLRYAVYEDPKGMSNIFNQYFINIEKKLTDIFHYDTKKYAPNSYGSLSFDNQFCIKIKTEDIINLVNRS